MSETAGWMDSGEGDDVSAMMVDRTGLIPRASAKQIAQEDRLDRQREREHARQLAERVEARRAADIQMFAEQAAARGEDISVLAVATGQVQGRSVADILADAAAQGDREDYRASRDPEGRLNLVGELAPPVTRSASVSPAGRTLQRRLQLFRERNDARRSADVADSALRSRMPAAPVADPDAARRHYGAECARIGSPVQCEHGYISTSCARCQVTQARSRGVSFR